MRSSIIQKYAGPHYRAIGTRGQLWNAYMNITPQAPFQGPPLPAGLGITWGGKIRGMMPNLLVRTSIRVYDQIREGLIGNLILGEKPQFKSPWKWL